MKSILGNLYSKCNNFLCTNRLVRDAIYLQHNILPMSFALFDYIYRSDKTRRIFNFYGNHIFQYTYSKRNKDQLGYWLARESVYWHFWRQSDTNEKIFSEILSLPGLSNLLNEPLTVVEVGFGMGKNYSKVFRKNNFKKYIGVEPNKFLCQYIKNRFKENNFRLIDESAEDFIKNENKFDVLISSNGVFMYMDKQAVDDFFKVLPSKGVKSVIILNEGSAGDVLRPDGTAMYDFKSRLIDAGYIDKSFKYKMRDDRVIYKYFVMY